MSVKRILVIDDDPEIAAFVSDVSRQLGFEVDVATDSEEFKRKFHTTAPDVIVLDIVMPGEDGIELMRYLAEHDCRSGIIIMSGYNPLYLKSGETLARDWGLRAITSLTKPIELDTLEQALLAA